MDSQTFKDHVKRLREVNSVIEKLDPAIRAEAFSLLSAYITNRPAKSPSSGGAAHEHHGSIAHEQSGTDDAEAFFGRQPAAKKPSDNVMLIAAYLYSQYGSKPFQLDEIRQLADSAGITIPSSPDMTLKQAARNGKAMFQHTRRNQYKPTVSGEIYFKENYTVKKGTKQRPTESKS